MRLQRPGAYKARQQASGGERFLVFLLHFKGNFVFLLYFTGLSPCKPPALFIPAPVQHPQLLLSFPHLSAPTHNPTNALPRRVYLAWLPSMVCLIIQVYLLQQKRITEITLFQAYLYTHYLSIGKQEKCL